jgi:hypothetical protein
LRFFSSAVWRTWPSSSRLVFPRGSGGFMAGLETFSW